MSEIIFEFSCDFGDDKIIECGVQIMTEEAEGSSSRQLDSFETECSSSEVDCYETESSSSELDFYETILSMLNHHTDGNGNGNYEAKSSSMTEEAEGSNMTEEAEGSSSRELDNFETESSSSEDGNGDENINKNWL
ncbi:unnamed protein product [Arabidopsis arenosa]|uniref:Uncharacterized protein n=1 Tax=Arabidopsis arenosa TaxID=38785 RepID=A0A8S2AW34_ARAAE|nr:unnamed protein product [Arabidopsis arenosa]